MKDASVVEIAPQFSAVGTGLFSACAAAQVIRTVSWRKIRGDDLLLRSASLFIGVPAPGTQRLGARTKRNAQFMPCVYPDTLIDRATVPLRGAREQAHSDLTHWVSNK